VKYRACRISRPPVLINRCWRLVNDQLMTVIRASLGYVSTSALGEMERFLIARGRGVVAPSAMRIVRGVAAVTACEKLNDGVAIGRLTAVRYLPPPVAIPCCNGKTEAGKDDAWAYRCRRGVE
jgi:hypothetical protein